MKVKKRLQLFREQISDVRGAVDWVDSWNRRQSFISIDTLDLEFWELRALARLERFMYFSWRLRRLTAYLNRERKCCLMSERTPVLGHPASFHTLCQKLACDLTWEGTSFQPGIRRLCLTCGRVSSVAGSYTKSYSNFQGHWDDPYSLAWCRPKLQWVHKGGN